MRVSVSLKKVMAAVASALLLSHAQSQPVVKVGIIEPLSGMMATVGQHVVKSAQAAIDVANQEDWGGGVKFQLVPFDNKLSPQESVAILRQMEDQNIRFVLQALSSPVAFAVAEHIARNATRDPSKAMVYLNVASIDPDLTGNRCGFWHFRTAADSVMRVLAMVTHLEKQKNVKAVYLLNQNTTAGKAVAAQTRQLLAQRRPDIQIVGEDFHPLAQIRDFTPYVNKIKASNADAVVSSNYGSDLTLFVKAAHEGGLSAHLYTFFANSPGAATAIGGSGVGRIRQVTEWHANVDGGSGAQFAQDFKAKHGEDFQSLPIYTAVALLAQAVKSAKTTDPKAVALALEGSQVTSFNGVATLKKNDHQILQRLYIAGWEKVDGKNVKQDVEGTGFGWKTIEAIEPAAFDQPTACNMVRP